MADNDVVRLKREVEELRNEVKKMRNLCLGLSQKINQLATSNAEVQGRWATLNGKVDTVLRAVRMT